jgi:hypothetical protein
MKFLTLLIYHLSRLFLRLTLWQLFTYTRKLWQIYSQKGAGVRSLELEKH